MKRPLALGLLAALGVLLGVGIALAYEAGKCPVCAATQTRAFYHYPDHGSYMTQPAYYQPPATFPPPMWWSCPECQNEFGPDSADCQNPYCPEHWVWRAE